MTKSRYRIPRLAAASLVLGGACGDDDKGDAHDTAGVNVSKSRIADLAKDFCANAFDCDPQGAKEEFDTEAACVASYKAYWQNYAETSSDECADAYLDVYACYSTAECGEEDTCDKLLIRAQDLCEDEGEASDDDG